MLRNGENSLGVEPDHSDAEGHQYGRPKPAFPVSFLEHEESDQRRKNHRRFTQRRYSPQRGEILGVKHQAVRGH